MIALTRVETGIPIIERRHTAIFTRNYREGRAEADALAAEIALWGKRGDPVESFSRHRSTPGGPHLPAAVTGENTDARGRRGP